MPNNAQSIDKSYALGFAKMLFGLGFSGLSVYIIVNLINGIFSPTGTIPLIINLVIVLVIFTLFFKILKVGSNPKVNQTYHLIVDIIFYIPCLFVMLYDNIPKLPKKSSKSSSS